MRLPKPRAETPNIKKTRIKGNTALSGNLIVRDDVILPTESIGQCERKSCDRFGYLADGFCQPCWDMGRGSPTTRLNEYLSNNAGKAVDNRLQAE